MLEELKAALAAATPGAWYTAAGSVRATTKVPPYDADAHIVCGMQGVKQDRLDAHLICLLKNNAEALIEAVKALEHMSVSFDELRNGWPERELHEPVQVTLDRAQAALAKLNGDLK